jgi:hypothetical protein
VRLQAEIVERSESREVDRSCAGDPGSKRRWPTLGAVPAAPVVGVAQSLTGSHRRRFRRIQLTAREDIRKRSGVPCTPRFLGMRRSATNNAGIPHSPCQHPGISAPRNRRLCINDFVPISRSMTVPWHRLPLTRLIHKNFWVVMSYAFATLVLSKWVSSRFHGEWKYLNKALF